MKKYGFRNIKQKINRYGYHYRYTDLIFEALAIIAFVEFIAWLTGLRNGYLLMVFIFSLLIIPFIIIAVLSFNGETKRFEMLVDYLSNVIPVFMQKSKINYTLRELSTLTQGKMKEKVDEALSYLENTSSDAELLRNSLKIIEKEYPCSRLKAVHEFMTSVELSSSIDYKEVAANLYNDVEFWIKQNYQFQKEIADKRNKLSGLCIMTLLMNVIFVYIYSSNEFFAGFIESPAYQFSNTVFIVLVLITIAVLLSKMNGSWLMEDFKKEDETKSRKIYLRINRDQKKLFPKEYIFGFILIVFALAVFLKGRRDYAMVLGILGLFILFKKKLQYASDRNYLDRQFKMEFPMWLRDIYLNISQMTVLNAVENSISSFSYPFRKELYKFLSAARKDPSSIKPYNDFLEEYDVEDARASMRLLYSLNNVSKKEVNERVGYLIERNQSMLNKSQELRNSDALGSANLIGFLPMIFFSLQMIVSMFIMFMYLMNNLGSMVTK